MACPRIRPEPVHGFFCHGGLGSTQDILRDTVGTAGGVMTSVYRDNAMHVSHRYARECLKRRPIRGAALARCALQLVTSPAVQWCVTCESQIATDMNPSRAVVCSPVLNAVGRWASAGQASTTTRPRLCREFWAEPSSGSPACGSRAARPSGNYGWRRRHCGESAPTAAPTRAPPPTAPTPRGMNPACPVHGSSVPASQTL